LVLSNRAVIYEDAIPLDPVNREGHAFLGWFLDQALEEEASDPVMGDSDITLYGSYQRLSYTVTYDTKGGDPIPAADFLFMDPIAFPEPFRGGYVFEGWFADSALTYPFTLTDMPARDVTLYASWAPTRYTITWHPDNGEADIVTDIGFEETIVPPTITKTGHTFAGWHTDAALETPLPYTTMPGYDLELFAKWETNTYTVFFETGVHPELDPLDVLYGDALDIGDLSFEGHAFLGWYMDASWTVPFDLPDMPAYDITLHARFVRLSYTLTVNFQNGLPDLVSDLVYDAPVTMPEDPVLEGHTFVGWFMDAEGTVPLTLSNMPDSDVVVYAGWETNTYVISYVMEPHGPIGDDQVLYGTTLSVGTPELFGYTFLGWFEDASLTIPFARETMPATDLTLHAAWEAVRHTLTLHVEETFSKIVTGLDYTVFLGTRGGLYVTGKNTNGQLGTGDRDTRTEPCDITHMFAFVDNETVIDVATGLGHTVVLTDKGRVFTFGNNTFGQLGRGDTLSSDVPVDITGMFALGDNETITGIDAGHFHTVFMTDAGRVFGTGANFHHQLGDGTSASRATPVEAALFADQGPGTVHAMPMGTSVTTSDGTIHVWGKNAQGQLGLSHTDPVPVPMNLSVRFADGALPVRYTGGLDHALILLSDGTLYGVGSNKEGELGAALSTPLFALSDITSHLGLAPGETILSIHAGDRSSAVVTSEGRVLVFGDNGNGQLGDGTKTDITSPFDLAPSISMVTAESVVQVSLRSSHVFVLSSLGRTTGIGENVSGRMGTSSSGLVHKPLIFALSFEGQVGYETPLEGFVPELDPLVFSGWYTDQSLTVPLVGDAMPFEELELWGRFLDE
jgi:uncharacterized repeat protein (TIGR02543 family)